MAQQSPENGHGTATGADALKEQASGAARQAKERYREARRELDDTIERLERQPAVQSAQSGIAQARQWIEDNPALAVLLAAGCGMLLGKLLAAAFSRPQPSFTDRTRDRAAILADQARRYAGEAGEEIARRSADVSRQARTRSMEIEDRIAKRARALGDQTANYTREWRTEAAHHAGDLGRHASEWGHRAAEQAARYGEEAGRQFDEVSHLLREQAGKLGTEAAVVGEEAARRARDVGETLSKQARTAASRAEETAHRLAKRVRPHEPTFSERFVGAFKTLLTAEVFRRMLKRFGLA